jgi:hypothetical protein
MKIYEISLINFKMNKNIEIQSGYIAITNDKLIQKKLITKGFGGTPIEGKEVTINYISKLPNGKQIDNTYIGREPQSFILGNNSIIPGIEIALKTMQMKEISHFIIYPEYTYKALDLIKKGELRHEEPCIIDEPEIINEDNAKYYEVLHVEIELIKHDNPRISKAKLPPDARIEEASKLKLEGNGLFKEKRYREAIVKYETGIDYLTQMPTDNLTSNVIDLRHQLYLNKANSHINLYEYIYALKQLEIAFSIKINSKCHYLRAVNYNFI